MLTRLASRQNSAMMGTAVGPGAVVSRDQNVKMSTRRTGPTALVTDLPPRTVDL